MKGRNEEALQVLARLHAHGDIHDTFVVSEHKEILAQVQLERQETRNAWSQLFLVKSNFRRLVLGVALQFRYVWLSNGWHCVYAKLVSCVPSVFR